MTASFEFTQVSRTHLPKAPESVADQIRSAILGGEIAVDSMLPPEAQLALTFGVSRPTIREALRILESERFISITRGSRGGALVLRPTSKYAARSIGHILKFQNATLADIYDARIELESSAAKLAAENNANAAAKAMGACVAQEFELIDDHPNIIEAIAEVHLVLLQQCGNLTLALLGAALQDIIRFQMTTVYAMRLREGRREFRREKLAEGFARHARMTELIAEARGEDARQFWRENMLLTREFWVPAGVQLELPPQFGSPANR